jgi:putative transcriptional regulator
VDPLTGQLLVAGPTLPDPNFARTVVLIAEHSETGALGLVLNRPAGFTVGEAVPDLAAALGSDAPMWLGGPVRPQGVLVLAEWDDPEPAAALIVGAIGLLGADADAAEVVASARRMRAYAGFAGWGPGQLDAELERDDWILAAARAPDVFCERAEDLWGDILRGKGGRFALMARMPEDPSVN